MSRQAYSAQNAQLLANMVDFDSETGEIKDNSELLASMLEEIEGLAGEKLDQLENVKRNIHASTDAISAEIARLQKRKKSLDANFESVKKLQVILLNSSSHENVKTDLNTFSFRTSRSVEVNPFVTAESLPDRFRTVKYSFNKTEMKKAIEAGEFIDGVAVETHKNLQVK